MLTWLAYARTSWHSRTCERGLGFPLAAGCAVVGENCGGRLGTMPERVVPGVTEHSACMQLMAACMAGCCTWRTGA